MDTKEKLEVENVAGEYRVVVRMGQDKFKGCITITIARFGSGTEDKANAHRFVKCGNGHDQLLEACKEIKEAIDKKERFKNAPHFLLQLIEEIAVEAIEAAES